MRGGAKEVVGKAGEDTTGRSQPDRCIANSIGIVPLQPRGVPLVVVTIARRCAAALHGEERGDRLVARAALQPQDGRLHAGGTAGPGAAPLRARMTQRAKLQHLIELP